MNLENPAPPDPSPASSDKPAEVIASSNSKLKDSTTDLPMFDLEEIVRFIATIHDQGLETARMPDVAKGCGYKHASSTPFYRKLVASRLFGLLVSNGAELTLRARDYLKPTQPESMARALSDAVCSVSYFSDYISKHTGKRFNLDLVGNDIARTFHLTDTAAKGCAKVFESSLKFANLLASDNTILSGCAAPPAKPKDESQFADDDDGEEPTQVHTLFLDKQKKRKFTMRAPISVSSAELKRICMWLEVTMIVEDDATSA